MLTKFLYRGLPMSLLLLLSALLQGFAIRAFAEEGVRAETVVAAEPEPPRRHSAPAPAAAGGADAPGTVNRSPPGATAA